MLGPSWRTIERGENDFSGTESAFSRLAHLVSRPKGPATTIAQQHVNWHEPGCATGFTFFLFRVPGPLMGDAFLQVAVGALHGKAPRNSAVVRVVGGRGRGAPEVLGRNVSLPPPGLTPPVVGRSEPAARMGVPAVLVLLLGAWGGIVPFVGPTFGWNGDGSPSWTWNLMHALLWVAPGAAACLGALGALALIPRFARGLGRIGATGAGLLISLTGAWFVIGPVAWPVFERSAGVLVPAPPLRELSYQVGYSLGPGVLLALLGGMTFGWALRGRRILDERVGRTARAAA